MPTDSDSYFSPRPELQHLISHKVSTLSNFDLPPWEYPKAGVETVALADKKKLLYYVDKVTGIHHLCIPPLVTTEIITLAHNTSHSGFSRYFEIITRF